MKKIILLLSFILLTGCSKPQSNNTPLINILNEMKVVAEFNNAQTADLKNQKTAAQYGINSDSISEGYVYYSTDKDSSDEVIIVRASSQKEIEEIEKAISTELSAKTTAWQNNEKESKKIENHIMRTIGDCVLLAIGEKSEEIDHVFNQLKS